MVRTTAALAALAALLALPRGTAGQETLTVTSSLPADGFVDRDAPIEVRADRPLVEGERLSLWIGDEDVTGLARPTAQGVRYVPGVRLLPSGSHELRVYLVSDGEWREVASLPLQVRSALGFESSDWSPSLTLRTDGQLAEGRDPAEESAARAPWDDLEGELALETEQVHRAFTLDGSAKVFGASVREKALRFGQRGEGAPRIDLAEYAVTAAGGPAEVTVGHVRTGEQRHLIQSFGSRGAQATVGMGSRVSLSGAVTGGSRMVGWSDPVGATDPDHRVWNASLGIEAAPTPGALRVDVGFMDGSVLPRSGFDRGAVVDAETSRGMGVRVRARGLDRRLTLDAGFARSSFDNPDDPTLSQGVDLVEVERESADARYLDASVALLRGLAVGAGRTASLSVGVRHERVDPLYRSVGARVRSDVLRNEVEVRADVAHASVRASLASSRDNLGDLASVLTTHTDRSAVTLGLPVARMAGSASSWLPRVQLRLDRTRQLGEGIPETGGFSASHVPDQLSTRRSATLDWRGSWLSVGYRWDASEQDNRQEGREDADILGSANAVAVGVSPFASLTLSLDAGLERSENVERDEVDDTGTLGARLDWRPLTGTALSLRWSRTASEDRAATRERLARTLDAQLSSPVPGLAGVDGQFVLRFSRRDQERSDLTFDVRDDRSDWTVSTGVSVTLQR